MHGLISINPVPDLGNGNLNSRKQPPLLPQHPRSLSPKHAWLGDAVALSPPTPTPMRMLSRKEANSSPQERFQIPALGLPCPGRVCLCAPFSASVCWPRVRNLIVNNQEFGRSENEPNTPSATQISLGSGGWPTPRWRWSVPRRSRRARCSRASSPSPASASPSLGKKPHLGRDQQARLCGSFWANEMIIIMTPLA